MSKTFTVFSGSDDRPNWLEMRPGHFDERELPKTRKAPQGQNELFSVADIAPATAKAPKACSEMDGQADLFSETD